jgi:hypothetical protein
MKKHLYNIGPMKGLNTCFNDEESLIERSNFFKIKLLCKKKMQDYVTITFVSALFEFSG